VTSRIISAAIALAVALLAGGSVLAPAKAAEIIAEWGSVKAPPPPALKPTTVDAKTTALLMLDFVKPSCNEQRGKRCVATLPTVKKLLDEARAKGMLVIYTAYGKLTEKDIVPEVAPTGGEPFVVSFLDKYLHTNLEKILKDKGIQTVITVGTFAHGAVLITADESAERGFKVIVPVDGMSADAIYGEQYTAWHLAHAPIVAGRTTLTTVDMIKF
jgi:nicotinamidase-related amidase